LPVAPNEEGTVYTVKNKPNLIPQVLLVEEKITTIAARWILLGNSRRCYRKRVFNVGINRPPITLELPIARYLDRVCRHCCRRPIVRNVVGR
jgi:hypothetical protein